MIVFLLTGKKNKTTSLFWPSQGMFKSEGGTNDTPYDWEDVTRAKSVLGPARLSFSSVHSSNGFTDGEDELGTATSSTKGGEANGNPNAAASHFPRRFQALEDSADYSEDSSARRRKRQQDLVHDQAALKAAATANANRTDALAADTAGPARKKKKKKKCVIQ